MGKSYEKLEKRYIILMILFVILLIINIIALIIVFFKGASKTDKEFDIKIGESETIETEIKLDKLLDSKELVPKNRILNDQQTDEIVFYFHIKWIPKRLINVMEKGVLTIKTTKFNFSDDNHLLEEIVNVKFDNEEIEIKLNEEVKIKVSITLNEPKTLDEYNLIFGQIISLVFEFNVEPI